MTRNDREPRRAEHNAETAHDWTDSQWASWYLAALDQREKRTFEPLRLHPDARIADEVEDVYVELRERSRYFMRSGVAMALRCWNQQHHSYAMLRGLCWITAQIRANEAVPVLLQILKDYRSFLFNGGDDTLAVADDFISILAGFVPDRDGHIEALFEDLLFDERVAPTFAATLGVAISTSDPKAFARCFNRYFLLRERAPEGYFSDEDVLAAFAEAVPRKVVEESVTTLTWQAYKYWMRVGVRTKRYSSDEYIVPLGSIVSLDLEGRTDIPDYTWPLRDEDYAPEELRMRYKIALDEVKRSVHNVENVDASSVTRRSALESVYALAG